MAGEKLTASVSARTTPAFRAQLVERAKAERRSLSTVLVLLVEKALAAEAGPTAPAPRTCYADRCGRPLGHGACPDCGARVDLCAKGHCFEAVVEAHECELDDEDEDDLG